MKYKRKTQLFMNGSKIEPKYIIQALHGGKWMPFGDENGIMKFDTKEERDAKIEELKGLDLVEG